MASFDTTRPVAGQSASKISAFFMTAFSAVAAWNDARITRKSLSKLTARELDDIGLTYSDIDAIATRSGR